MLLQTIFIGIITFSIPFLWNAYQKILDKKEKTVGDKINNILAREFYIKSMNHFEMLVQYPVGILIFFGLFVALFLPVTVSLVFLVVIFLYFLFLPQIFQWVEKKSTTDLRAFLLCKSEESPDIKRAFFELWAYDDKYLEEEFSIRSVDTFERFSEKIDRLLEKEKPKLACGLLEDFERNIKNRSTVLLLILGRVFPRTLGWHLTVWRGIHELPNRWSDYIKLSRALRSIIEKVEMRALVEGEFYTLFHDLRNHAENFQNESAEVRNGRSELYIEDLLNLFYQTFFENVTDSPEEDNIWERYFPKEWKITKRNWEKRDNQIVRISWRDFLRWATPRIQRAEEDFDRKLENVTSNLFPEVDPTIWSKILLFVISPYDPSSRTASVIRKKWNFGLLSRIRTYVGAGEENEEESSRKFREAIRRQEDAERRNTFELTLLLFKDQFPGEKIQEYMKELKGLEYERESKEEIKRLKLLHIFEEMLKFISNQG